MVKRIAKAAGVATASCALIICGAGVSAAHTDTAHEHHHAAETNPYANGAEHEGYDAASHDNGAKAGHGRGHDGGGNSATAEAVAIGSPGFLSGNIIQLPINAPFNNCGNTELPLDLIQLPLLGTTTNTICVNG